MNQQSSSDSIGSGVPSKPDQIRLRGLSFVLPPRKAALFAQVRAAIAQVIVADEYRSLVSPLRPGDVVVDCGANVGCFSLLAARQIGPGGHIVAVEPDLSNLAYLRANLALNGANNVVVIPRALARVGGQIRPFAGSGVSGHLAADGGQQVLTITLAELLAERDLKRIDALKIDIEGGESELLQSDGFHRVLQSTQRVSIEVHTPEARDQYTKALREAGLRVRSNYREGGFLTRICRNLLRTPWPILGLYATDLIRVGVRVLKSAIVPAASAGQPDSTFQASLLFAERMVA